MINAVAQKITKVTFMSAAMDLFKQSSLEEVAVVPKNITLTRMFVVVVKSTAKRPDRAVVKAEFITLHCQFAAMAEYSINGAEPRVADHATITLKASYAVTVKLFQRYTVLHAVARGLIVQTSMFAVITRLILVETELHAVEVLATKQANKFVVLVEFYPEVVVRHVVVPTIITLPDTFAAMVTCCQNQQEQLAAGLLIIIHLDIYAVAIMCTLNHLALTAVLVGAYTIVRPLMESP